MEELKYTTLQDIKSFLKKLNFCWTGKIYTEGKLKKATIDDIKNIVTYQVYKRTPNRNNSVKLDLYITDKCFCFIIKGKNKNGYIADHSVIWQAYLIEQKDISYAKYIYESSVKELQEKEKCFNKKLNLIQKRAEHLQYQKALEMAKLNTTLLNAKCKLYDLDINEFNKLF